MLRGSRFDENCEKDETFFHVSKERNESINLKN